MSVGQIAILVAVFLIMDAVVVGAVLRSAGGSLRELAAAFPPVEPLAGGVSREFQTFRFDMVNLGWSVHVIADERHLHLRGAWIARVAMGFRAASVPWEQVREVTLKRPDAKYASAKIGTASVMGPAWCLELARGNVAKGNAEP